jgi:hypothetical protein
VLDDAQEAGGIGEIAVVDDKARGGLVGVLVQVIDAMGVEQRHPALDAMYGVPLAQQEL